MAAVASAIAAWLVYRRDWTVEHEVLEPECYWIGYQLESESSPIKPAIAFPLHLVNRRGTSSVQGDLMVKVERIGTDWAIWLEPEFRLRSQDAVSTDWTSRQLFGPMAVGGRESVSWIIIATHCGHKSFGHERVWQRGEYRVIVCDVKHERLLFETSFRLNKTVIPDWDRLPIRVFKDDYGLSPRDWTTPTRRARARLMATFNFS